MYLFLIFLARDDLQKIKSQEEYNRNEESSLPSIGSFDTMSPSRKLLDERYASILQKREAHNRLRRLTLRDPNAVDFSSNSYLSLSAHPDIKRSYIAHLEAGASSTPRQQQQQQEAFSLGSGGSRLLDGNTAFAEKLEANIAQFHGAPAGLLFNSGFEANTGLFACAPQNGDYVVYDELIHASVHDGMRLGRAKRTLPFAHNCVTATGTSTSGQKTAWTALGPLPSLQSLDEVLSGLLAGQDGDKLRGATANVFIAVEAVYSMDGDVALLQDIVECVERHLPRGNGHVIVDEAHSTGWLGYRGKGLVSELGLEDRIWARLHTFGKAMGCAGGTSENSKQAILMNTYADLHPHLSRSEAIVLCTPITRAYLVNYARSLIYTTAMGYPLLVAIQTAYGFLELGKADGMLRHLTSLMGDTYHLLVALSQRHRPPPHIFRINTMPPESPIIPLFSSRSRHLARHCQQRGFMVRPIVAPTVPEGTDRVRLCLHSANTVAEVRGFCTVIDEWLQEQLADHEPAVAASEPERVSRAVAYVPAPMETFSKL